MDPSTAAAAREGRYAALLASAHTLTSDELLEVIEGAQRDKDAASARQAIALAHLSAREPTLQEDGTEVEVHRGLGHQRLDAPELAAPRMGVSVHVATNRVTDAIHQLTRTPAVLDALAAGDLDERRAAVVTEETDILDVDDAAAVVDEVAPHWAGLTVGPLRRLLSRTVARLAPDAVAAEAERARERRGLHRVTGEHGVDQWRADLLVETSRPAWVAVTERARQLVRDGHAASLAQGRADAMTQLILEHSDVRVVVHATRADATSASTSTGWVEVGGLGAPGTTVVPAPWLDHAGAGGELVCHPVTGALTGGDVPAGLATGRDITGTSTGVSGAYRIPAAMARFIRLRDGGCRFPGCSTPARQCDLDHIRPWPTGPTHISNLIALCRRHHRIKQRDGWTVRLDADGATRWTDPSGAVRTTSAVDHLHLGTTTSAHPPPRTAPTATRHIDLSLLDDHLSELLDHDSRHRHRARRRGAEHARSPLAADASTSFGNPWATVLFDHPPREPQPDVIPF